MVLWSVLPSSLAFKVRLQVSTPVVYLQGITSLERSLSSALVLSGSVVLQVTKPLKLWEIRIVFAGVLVGTGGRRPVCEEKCLWTLGTASLFRPVVDLWGDILPLRQESQCEWLAPGSYEYPFLFVVAAGLPESLESESGGFTYTLTALVISFDRGSQRCQTVEKPVRLVRTLLENSPLATQMVVSTGSWRGLMDYTVTIDNKCFGQLSTIAVAVKLTPIISHSYLVHAVRVLLEQTVRCRTLETTKPPHQAPPPLTTTTTTLMLFHLMRESDVSEGGKVEMSWKVPLKRDLKDDETAITRTLHPYTYHRNHPHLKISHTVRVAVLLEPLKGFDLETAHRRPLQRRDLNGDRAPSPRRDLAVPKAGCGLPHHPAAPSQPPPAARRPPAPPSPGHHSLTTGHRVELTLSAPVVILSGLCPNLTPPTYADAVGKASGSGSVRGSSAFRFPSTRTPDPRTLPPSYRMV